MLELSYICTVASGEHYRHGRDGDAFVTEILRPDLTSTGLRFAREHPDTDLAVSADLSRVALADDQAKTIEVFDDGSSVPKHTLRRPSYGVMLMSPDGARLFIKSRGGYYLWDLETDALTKLSLAVDDLSLGVPLRSGAAVVIPGRRRGVLVRLDLEAGASEALDLGVPTTFYRMRAAPSGEVAMAIGKDKTLYLVDLREPRVLASIPLVKHLSSRRDHVGTGCFSGNGALFCATVSGADRNHMLVVDVERAEYTHAVDAMCYGLPWIGDWVRSESTCEGSHVFKAVNLRTGVEVSHDLREPIHSQVTPT